MASGRPVIATDVGGIREAVGDAGVLVAPRSPGELARACLALLSEPVRRLSLGEAGRRRVFALFTAERSLDKYRSLYTRLVEPPVEERSRLVLLPSTYSPDAPTRPELVLVGEGTP